MQHKYEPARGIVPSAPSELSILSGQMISWQYSGEREAAWGLRFAQGRLSVLQIAWCNLGIILCVAGDRATLIDEIG